MLDLRVAEDIGTGEFDLVIENGQLATVNDMSTAILVSLLTDQRADISQVSVPQFRRGWIGDAVPAIENFMIGSLLWLVEPSKATQQTMTVASGFARQALEHLIEQGIAIDVQVSGEITGPRQGRLTILVQAPDGTTSSQYVELWERTSFEPSRLPLEEFESLGFTPAEIPELSIWLDADFSEHDVDDQCGVLFTQDLAGNFDYFQDIEARRPKRLLGSKGWFYRCDGVDDFMASRNQIFPSIREGSAFLLYKPGAVSEGDVIYSLGVNGFTDAVRGIAFKQGAGNNVVMIGDNGNLEVTVLGGSAEEDPVGIVFRWGLPSRGADGDTTEDQKGFDQSYVTEIPTPSQAILGAGFDGMAPDPTNVAAFDLNVFSLWSRYISDVEVFRLKDYARTRRFASVSGEQFSDCTYFSDDEGFS